MATTEHVWLAEASVTEQLERARRELLDFTLRNNLLNYRRLKTRGVEVVDEISREVYRILVQEEKVMSFLPAPERPLPGSEQLEGERQLWEQPDEDEADENGIAARHTDDRLQTPCGSAVLQSRLRQSYGWARNCLQEQGVNTLFLSLGMLNWRESTGGQKVHQAPLILVPVELSRSSVRTRFKVRYSGEEVGSNLSLQAKLQHDFGIQLPVLPDSEEVDLDRYFSEAESAVRHMPGWAVEPNAIALGFFSFAKFLMFKDLEAASWPRGSRPHEHPLIQALFGAGFDEPKPRIESARQLDSQLPPSEAIQIVDADSSQLLAINDVRDGRNLIIQGPPGTGKSQTITNLIAQCLAAGKKVLFVAEKMAALEVVKRRLDQIGLGVACLELHSQKARKRTILAELKRTLQLGKPGQIGKKDDVARLAASRDRLNSYCEAVNTPVGKTGVTPYQAVGELLGLAKSLHSLSAPRFNPSNFEGWERSQYSSCREVVEELQALLAEAGAPRQHPFWGCRKDVLLPTEDAALREALLSATRRFAEFDDACAELAEQARLDRPSDPPGLQRLLQAARRLFQAPELEYIGWSRPEWLQKSEQIQAGFEAGKILRRLHEACDSALIPEAWQEPVLPLRKAIKAHGHKWWRFLYPSYRRARNELQALCRGEVPRDGKKQLDLVDSILEAQRQTGIYSATEGLLEELVGKISIRQADWPRLISAAEWMKTLHARIEGGYLPSAILRSLEESPDRECLGMAIHALEASQQEFDGASSKLFELLQFDSLARFPQGGMQQASFEAQSALLDEWICNFERLRQIVRWNQFCIQLRQVRMDELVEIASGWRHPHGSLVALTNQAWYTAILDTAIRERQPLASFDGRSHEQAVERFKRLDQRVLKSNQALLVAKHRRQLPSPSDGGRLGVLLREFEKKRCHLPIRRLMAQAGDAIQAIKPIFMMSPLSIAKFLPQGRIQFDTVIFDEASQVEPVDALGAILRSSQAVVVGDAKQLPPTRFFDRVFNEDDSEEESNRNYESILGLFSAKGAPARRLRWHYRSQHESLIAVSNQEFYDNDLVVFPSPNADRADFGLSFRHLPEAAYQPGAGRRCNPEEAQQVARDVMRHARRHPNKSLGVAAFSQAQAQAIEDRLEILRRKDSSLEHFFRSHAKEPFFIKNLENVQGDERDVIFISVGYGKQQGGWMRMNFGPLNWEGGERRLNVLITRARQRCVAYANFTAADMELKDTASKGLSALKTFLNYAQTRILDRPQASGRGFDSPFEEQVAKELVRMGYKVDPQVGTGGFFIDLAIVDPERPGRYLLGIECDGASYHSAKTARDRDRLRQQVLEEKLHWTIHRIWSTDWFGNPGRELERVSESIERARSLGSPFLPGLDKG